MYAELLVGRPAVCLHCAHRDRESCGDLSHGMTVAHQAQNFVLAGAQQLYLGIKARGQAPGQIDQLAQRLGRDHNLPSMNATNRGDQVDIVIFEQEPIGASPNRSVDDHRIRVGSQNDESGASPETLLKNVQSGDVGEVDSKNRHIRGESLDRVNRLLSAVNRLNDLDFGGRMQSLYEALSIDGLRLGKENLDGY